MIGRRAFLRAAFVATASIWLAPDLALRRRGVAPPALVDLLQKHYLPAVARALEGMNEINLRFVRPGEAAGLQEGEGFVFLLKTGLGGESHGTDRT